MSQIIEVENDPVYTDCSVDLVQMVRRAITTHPEDEVCDLCEPRVAAMIEILRSTSENARAVGAQLAREHAVAAVDSLDPMNQNVMLPKMLVLRTITESR